MEKLLEALTLMRDREDYPFCVFCTEKTGGASFSHSEGIISYHCFTCGESVEVDIGTRNERLL